MCVMLFSVLDASYQTSVIVPSGLLFLSIVGASVPLHLEKT